MQLFPLNIYPCVPYKLPDRVPG